MRRRSYGYCDARHLRSASQRYAIADVLLQLRRGSGAPEIVEVFHRMMVNVVDKRENAPTLPRRVDFM